MEVLRLVWPRSGASNFSNNASKMPSTSYGTKENTGHIQLWIISLGFHKDAILQWLGKDELSKHRTIALYAQEVLVLVSYKSYCGQVPTPSNQQNQYQTGDLVLWNPKENPLSFRSSKLAPMLLGTYAVQRQVGNDVPCTHHQLLTKHICHSGRLTPFFGTDTFCVYPIRTRFSMMSRKKCVLQLLLD